MIIKIDHIGIATNELDKTIAIYEKIFGRKFDVIEELKDQNIRVAKIKIGEVSIEFVEPLNSGPIKKFLSTRGEGIHHIAFEVDNIEEELKKLDEAGFQLIDKEPRVGAEGKKIAFIHPKSTAGVLVELCE